VTVIVKSVNDLPTIETVDGEPVTTDTLEYTMEQGTVLVIHYEVADVDGDEILVTLTSLAVVHDEKARTITYSPDNDEVGTITFTFHISDVVQVSEKISLDFIITVEDSNDPMGEPQILNPTPGAWFKVNTTFTLLASCEDPDIPYGQVLNYTWESSISGLLGHGSSLDLSIPDPGMHLITVTVRDPEFSATATITVNISPEETVDQPPPTNGDVVDPGTNWALIAAIIVVLVIIGVVAMMMFGKRPTEGDGDHVDAPEEPAESQITADADEDPASEWEVDGEEWAEVEEL
jgi:hypothetical protein